MHGDVPKQAKAERGAKPAPSRRGALFVVIALALVGIGYYAFFAGAPQQARFGRGRGAVETIPVLAVESKRADVPVFLEAVGTTRALNTVTVRPQVDGKLLSINFNEGQDVKKGDVLAQIDPTTYQAALNQATAKKAQDEAQLSNARLDLERYERLAASNAINRQQSDTQRALVAQYAALVQADQAAIGTAQAMLSYTAIVAPLDGRTGIRQVDAGNIVHASDATGIVTITQIRPISVLFNMPQQDLDRVNAAFARNPLPVEALRSDNDQVIARGKLTVIDNQVDQATGTVRLKAEFPNPDLQLWPGQFLNVRLLVDTLSQVTVIPTGAVQRGPGGTFVYIVKDDSTVTMQAVTVRMQDEDQAVIAGGVEPPQRVVTTGFARLTDGSKVAVSAPGEPAPVPRAPAQRRRGQQGTPPAAGAAR